MAITLQGAPGSVLILLNDGSGETFIPLPTQITVGNEPTGIALGQLNGDSALDIVVCNAADDTVSVLLNNNLGDGTFSTPLSVPFTGRPRDIATGDANEDGLIDIAVVTQDTGELALRFGDGTGAFPTELRVGIVDFPDTIEPADTDNDKDIDFITASSLEGIVALVILEAGQASNVLSLNVGQFPSDITAADLDLDPGGLLDIVTTNLVDGTISVLIQSAPNSFRPAANLPIGALPRSLTSLDIDNDGDIDLAAVAGDDDGLPAVRVLRNDLTNGTLGFSLAETITNAQSPLLVASARLDPDPIDDLFIVTGDDGAEAATGGLPAAGYAPVINATDTCPADITGPSSVPDGNVDALDFLLLIGQWGSPCSPCHADITGPASRVPDGNVDSLDFLLLISQWGSPGSCL